MCTFEVVGLSCEAPPPQFHEKTPREGRNNENCGGRGKKKKREIFSRTFGAPPFGALRGHTLRSSIFLGSRPQGLTLPGPTRGRTLQGPTLQGPTLQASPFRAPLTLSKQFGQIRSKKLAKCGQNKIGQMRSWPNSVWPNAVKQGWPNQVWPNAVATVSPRPVQIPMREFGRHLPDLPRICPQPKVPLAGRVQCRDPVRPDTKEGWQHLVPQHCTDQVPRSLTQAPPETRIMCCCKLGYKLWPHHSQ